MREDRSQRQLASHRCAHARKREPATTEKETPCTLRIIICATTFNGIQRNSVCKQYHSAAVDLKICQEPSNYVGVFLSPNKIRQGKQRIPKSLQHRAVTYSSQLKYPRLPSHHADPVTALVCERRRRRRRRRRANLETPSVSREATRSGSAIHNSRRHADHINLNSNSSNRTGRQLHSIASHRIASHRIAQHRSAAQRNDIPTNTSNHHSFLATRFMRLNLSRRRSFFFFSFSYLSRRTPNSILLLPPIPLRRRRQTI